ncbi:MAG: Txe/YoeB family addiction module toxin [Treponema sp.]|jgi:toxin YoeB|nr:Txe/YoeB family addiction module toxin [Treponema sp.]
MKISFYDDEAFEEFTNWAQEDKKIFKKIGSIIKDIKRNPKEGIGKPEPLKHELSGYWSRRIDDEHRLVYQIVENSGEIIIVSCKKHYENRP